MEITTHIWLATGAICGSALWAASIVSNTLVAIHRENNARDRVEEMREERIERTMDSIEDIAGHLSSLEDTIVPKQNHTPY